MMVYDDLKKQIIELKEINTKLSSDLSALVLAVTELNAFCVALFKQHREALMNLDKRMMPFELEREREANQILDLWFEWAERNQRWLM